ncbi:MAG: N-acetyltransferase [Acidobacteriia bacterium]|nr:N-acetyltransferase [Terriglobia bacterium]
MSAAAGPPSPAARASAVRVRAARTGDIETLERFIADYTHDGTLLPRTHANLVQHLRDFRVAHAGARLVGCGALQIVGPELAEIRSVAVDPAYRGLGIGWRIVKTLVADARRRGVPRLFCLTRRADFFARQGFVEVPKERFPHKVWNDCRLCPRRHACDEVAMERPLTVTARRSPPANEARAAIPAGELRVVSTADA